MFKKYYLLMIIALAPVLLSAATYLGNYNTDRSDTNSVNNPLGKYGSQTNPISVNNPHGEYGSKYSNKSANNPYASAAPKLYDQDGNYRGRLSANKYDPDSILNPHGKYGSKYSPDSINNPHGAGRRCSTDIISIYGE